MLFSFIQNVLFILVSQDQSGHTRSHPICSHAFPGSQYDSKTVLQLTQRRACGSQGATMQNSGDGNSQTGQTWTFKGKDWTHIHHIYLNLQLTLSSTLYIGLNGKANLGKGELTILVQGKWSQTRFDELIRKLGWRTLEAPPENEIAENAISVFAVLKGRPCRSHVQYWRWPQRNRANMGIRRYRLQPPLRKTSS